MTNPSLTASIPSNDHLDNARHELVMRSRSQAPAQASVAPGSEEMTGGARWWQVCDRAAARLAAAPRARRHQDLRARLRDYLNTLRK